MSTYAQLAGLLGGMLGEQLIGGEQGQMLGAMGGQMAGSAMGGGGNSQQTMVRATPGRLVRPPAVAMPQIPQLPAINTDTMKVKIGGAMSPVSPMVPGYYETYLKYLRAGQDPYQIMADQMTQRGVSV